MVISVIFGRNYKNWPKLTLNKFFNEKMKFRNKVLLNKSKTAFKSTFVTLSKLEEQAKLGLCNIF